MRVSTKGKCFDKNLLSISPPREFFILVKRALACSKLQDSGEKSFNSKKREIREGALATTAPFPMSRTSYVRFARFNTSPLYYLRAWQRLSERGKIKPQGACFPAGALEPRGTPI